MEEQEGSKDIETSVLHKESGNCQCPECDNLRKRYIHILDVDEYVNALNDWD